MKNLEKSNKSRNSVFKADSLLNKSDANRISVRGCEARCINNNVDSSHVRNGNG